MALDSTRRQGGSRQGGGKELIHSRKDFVESGKSDFHGGMSEWSKEHAWKVCIPQKGIKGSNPFSSAQRPMTAPEPSAGSEIKRETGERQEKDGDRKEKVGPVGGTVRQRQKTVRKTRLEEVFKTSVQRR